MVGSIFSCHSISQIKPLCARLRSLLPMDDLEAALEDLAAADAEDEKDEEGKKKKEEEGKKSCRRWRHAKVKNKSRKLNAATEALQQIESATVA